MKKIIAILLALCAILTLCACNSPSYAHGSKKTVLTLGKNKVSEEFYRYFLLNTMAEMADGDAKYFEGNDREEKLAELEKRTLKALKEYYAVLDLAKKLKITLTGAEEDSVHVAMKAMRAEFDTDAEYEKALADTYLSEYVAYALYYNESVYTALYDVTSRSGEEFSTDGTDILRYAKKNFYFCRQIVVETEDVEGDFDALYKAEAIRSRLLDGEDPAVIMQDYEDDVTVVGGYYCYAKSEDYAALNEDAVAAMKEGEISEIRKDGYGFHILMRLEPDAEYLEENLSGTVFESYCMHQLTLLLEEISDGYEVAYKNKKEPESYK